MKWLICPNFLPILFPNSHYFSFSPFQCLLFFLSKFLYSIDVRQTYLRWKMGKNILSFTCQLSCHYYFQLPTILKLLWCNHIIKKYWTKHHQSTSSQTLSHYKILLFLGFLSLSLFCSVGMLWIVFSIKFSPRKSLSAHRFPLNE